MLIISMINSFNIYNCNKTDEISHRHNYPMLPKRDLCISQVSQWKTSKLARALFLKEGISFQRMSSIGCEIPEIGHKANYYDVTRNLFYHNYLKHSCLGNISFQ